jgi:hypothetical protein
MFDEKDVNSLLGRYSRSKEDVKKMKQRVSDRQKQFKIQAKKRALSNETLMRCYNV